MTTLFDVGDMQRLRREESLSEESPRQPFRSPDDSIMNTEREAEEFQTENPFDFLLDGMLAALKERL